MGFRSSISLLPAIVATGAWLFPRRVKLPLNAPAFAGRTDDPEVLAAVPVGPLDPIKLDAGDFEGMGHVRVPEAGNGLNLKGHAPKEIDSPGFLDRTGPAFEHLFRIAHDDEGLFTGLHQKMSSQLFPAQPDHALGDVQTVSQDDIDRSGVPLEEPAQESLRSRELLASIIARLQIGDGGVSAQDLQDARIAPSETRAINGRGPKRTAFGQCDLAVTLLAKEHAGLLKLFADLNLIHSWKDSPEGGVRSNQVPRGAQPLPDFLLSSEEIQLVKALAMKRQTSDQKQEQRRHRDVGVLAELRKAMGLLTEMELVVAEFGKVCQTGRYPLLSIVQARGKREKTPEPELGRNSTPANYRKRGGFARASTRSEIRQSSMRGFSLFAGARAAPRPAPSQ